MLFPKTYSFFLAVVFSYTCFGTGNTKTANSNSADTVNVPTERFVALSEYDSTILFPAFEIYCQWDTNNIHPYGTKIKSIYDTSKLYLVDHYNCGYVAPYMGEITSEFGIRHGRPHYGIDINLETGDSVKAAFAGKVRISRRNRTYGNVVIIRHDNGLETIYAHLSKLLVSAEDYVEPGDLIGLGGNTGRSYGSHLHFELRYKGIPLDPSEVISFEKGELLSDTLQICQESFAFVAKMRAAQYHTIRKGDTLSGIARRYGTSVSRLCRLNNMRSSTVLRIGRRIRYR